MKTCTMPPVLRKLTELFLVFILTSFIGWLYEVFLDVVIYRCGYSDRGVLTGPYCPVYGVGAVVLLFCLYSLSKRKITIGSVSITPFLVFFGILMITTAIELGASYIMEWTTGGWMWDYTRFHPNFQGRIALNPSIRFGIGGMVFLYLLYPLLKRFLSHCSDQAVTRVSLILAVLFLADCWIYILSISLPH